MAFLDLIPMDKNKFASHGLPAGGGYKVVKSGYNVEIMQHFYHKVSVTEMRE